MLTAPSQLLMRNVNALAGRRLLIVNAPQDPLARSLLQAGADGIALFSQSWADHDFHRRQAPEGCDLAFGALPGDESGGAAVVFLPREKALARLLLRAAASCLPPGGDLLLVGENRAGAKSAGKLLAETCAQWNKLDSARHCTLFRGRIGEPPPRPDPKAQMRTWQETIADQPLTLASLPGVFSHRAIDPATRMLLSNLPPLAGDVLDYGCGAGVIGAFVARQNPQCNVHLIDDSALAIASSAATFQANGLQARSILPSDGFSEVEGRFDAIVSNPPFHRGVKTDYRASEALIEQAPDYLRPGGRLIIVANAFLDYPRRIERRFGNVTPLAADNRFRVYMAACRG